MKQQQRGFTLIELVVVITILGILAAFALPRFSNLESSARAASVDGITGSLRSASALVHAVWLANGGGSLGTISLEGASVNVAANGYATDATIRDALQDFTGFTESAAGTFQKLGATQPANCQVDYTNGGGAGTVPTITPDTTNC